jgi:hypothetical protein
MISQQTTTALYPGLSRRFVTWKASSALIAKLSSPTEEMMLAGALAHNAGLRPIRASITASDAKKIFNAMIAVLKESLRPCV